MIPDSALLANFASTATVRSSFGVRGRPNFTVSGRTITGQTNRNGNDGTITRFGWKAQNKSLMIFSGEAYNVEMGITNENFPTERDETVICQFAPLPNTTPNFDADHRDRHASAIEKFSVLHALPRAADAFARHAGRRAIHRKRQGAVQLRRLRVLSHPFLQDRQFAALANQTVNLFSDLMIHDMGVGLSDGVSQGSAGPREFRTAPLWGLGQRMFFLHDGRTSDLISAIRAHQSTGSEANSVVSRFTALSETQKQNLLNFLRSL